MPARKINYVPDWIQEVELQPSDIDLDPYKGFTVKPITNYLSQHSDREYETLLKAFLLLGERYDKLQSNYEEALGDIDDMIEQQIIEDEYRDWQGE